MSISFDAFIGRGNTRTLTLTQGGATVAENAITRVVMRLGANCLDTDAPSDPFDLVNNATQVEMKLGLWEHAAAGTLEGHLVVYDALSPEGLAWPELETISVTFHDWEVCAT